MSTVYQGSSDTAAIQRGATGAQNALVIPFENSSNPASYLEDIPNLRLIRVNQNTNFPEYWDGTAWVVIGSNTEISSINFKIGDPDAPANGSTTYTLPDEFEGQAIEIFSSDLGRFLIAGEDYSRSPTVTGLELTLLNGKQFLTGGYWNISGGKAIDGAQEVLDEAKAYTDDSALSKTVDEVSLARHNFINGFQINGGFTPVYKTYAWIVPDIQNNPTNNTQAIYVQHRVAGNLGGLVQDAAAFELRLNNVTNTGTGQSACENSLVMTGGVNNTGLLCGTLSNFHATGNPTGTIDRIYLCASTQIPTLPAGLTVGTAVSVYGQSQTVGTNNYTFFADGGNSVIPIIVPKDINSVGLIVRGLLGQVSAPFAIQNSLGSTTYAIQANGTGGFGGTVSGVTSYVNNNIGATTTANFGLKANAGQTGAFIRLQNSADAVVGFIDVDGGIKCGGNTKSSSAIIDVQSTTKGALLPRMTTAQRTAIVSPAEGLEVYDLTLHKKCFYNGTSWEQITSTII